MTVAFLVRPNSDSGAAFIAALPWFLTYTINWYPSSTFLRLAWSLAAEEQFYAFWPPVERWLKGKALLGVLFAFVFVNQLVNFGVFDEFLETFGMGRSDLEIMAITFTPIFLGVLLAHILFNEKGYNLALALVGKPWSPVVVLGVFILLASWPVADIGGLPRTSIHLCMMVFLASVVVRKDNILGPVLRFYPIARMGATSYGMYLFHMIVRHPADFVVSRLGLDLPLSLFFICLLFTVLISELSFRFYEQPFLGLKKRIGQRGAEGPPGTSLSPEHPREAR